MKIHLVSDIHNEMDNVVTPMPKGTNVVVLAENHDFYMSYKSD